MKAGKFKTFKLQHGPSVREFKNVEVRHPEHKGTVIKDRWELEGIELKTEVSPGVGLIIVETPVEVGFLPENVIE